MISDWNRLESLAIAGDSPVQEALSDVLSRAEHVKFCLKIGGPPPKAKYSLLTDSEPVP